MAVSTTSVKLDSEMKTRVQRLATDRRRSAHWLMREAIEQYLDREERRASFHASALAAWEDFQTSGLHVTAKEADDWLALLEAGAEAQPPECHA